MVYLSWWKHRIWPSYYQVTDIKGEEVSFDSVQAQIKGEFLYGKALDEYATNAEDFNNTVYENSADLLLLLKNLG